MVPPGDGHDCGWKAYAEHQSKQIEELKEQLEALKRQVFGKKTEKRKLPKLPPPLPPPSSTPEQAKKRREDNKLLRDSKLETEVTHSSVCRCEKCGSTNLTLVTEKPSVVYEYVQPHFRKRVIQRAVARCDNGHLTTAPGPARVGEKTQYAPSFLAHLAAAKCRDSIPLYTLEKGYKSIGIPISRSTMTDLLQRVGQELAPLYQAALEIIREAPDVHADETSMRQQGLTSKAYV
jgi:transposase